MSVWRGSCWCDTARRSGTGTDGSRGGLPSPSLIGGLDYGDLFLGHPEFTLSEVGYTAADARPEGGESLLDQRERVLDAFIALGEELAADETAVVVTHGGPLYLIVGWARGLDIQATILDQEQGNCAINELALDGEGIEVVVENDTDHLDAELA